MLFLLAVLGFVVLSMTPRGLALCIGGGHELAESLAGWCDEHRKHVHPPHDEEHDGCDHSHKSDHSDPHHHHDHTAPCADIPLGLDDCRPQVVKWSLDMAHQPLAAPIAQVQALDGHQLAASDVRFRDRYRDASWSGPPMMERACLRAVVLLI